MMCSGGWSESSSVNTVADRSDVNIINHVLNSVPSHMQLECETYIIYYLGHFAKCLSCFMRHIVIRKFS
ncbi:hypothetical protein YC2023_022617 [Brassica napus]